MDHFTLEFTQSGLPRLCRSRYDSRDGTWKHYPIPRESQIAKEALASPAGRWYVVIRAAHNALAAQS